MTIGAALLLLLAGLGCRADRVVSVPGFFRYERDDVQHLLERAGRSQPWEVFEIRRDSTGSRLYLYGWSHVATVDESGKLTHLSKALPTNVFCGAEGVSEETCRGIPKQVYFSDAGNWAVWMSPTEAHFAGWARPVSRGWLWVDPGAKHYLVFAKGGDLEFGTVDGHLKHSISGIDPLALYSMDGTVYVFGIRADVELVCWVYREKSLGYELDRAVKIAPFGGPSVGIVDMDLDGKRVVVEKNYDMSQPWFLFDFRTGVLTRIGQKSAYGAFLRKDLLRNHREGPTVDEGAAGSRTRG